MKKAPCSAPPGPINGTSIEWRVDPSSGATNASGNRDGGGRDIGRDLIDPMLRKPELIERRVNGKTVWTRRLAAIFGRGVSTDNGWLFEQYGKAYAGTVSAPAALSPSGPRAYTIDLDHDLVSAGFRARDGRRLWQSSGTYVDCFGRMYLGGKTVFPVRCRYAGSVTYHDPRDGVGGTTRITTDASRVALEGFDPATGKTHWSQQLAPARSLFDGDSAPVASDEAVVVKTPERYLVIDLRTGAARTPLPNEAFWCERDIDFQAIPQQLPEGAAYRVGKVAAPCRPDGKLTSVLPRSVPAAVATSGPDGLRLVATAHAVAAYRVG